ncbi:MAG: CBS domain-containing protein [Chloroflexota bacterium]
MTNNSDWITTREAAARLNVTMARVRQMVAEEKLTARKLGGKYRGQWLVKSSDLTQRLQKKGANGTMKVKNRMTHNPIVASPKTTYNEALRLMKENAIKHLPIVDKGDKLVGIVTHSDMLRVEPSPATTLNVYEIVSLLDKMSLDKVMQHPVLTVEESCGIANAAKFMLEHEIGCLPVMRDDKVIGIITDTDIFKTFIEVTGGGQAGSRIEVKVPDQKGLLAPLAQAFSNAGSYIVSVVITYDETGDFAYVNLKERGGSEDAIRDELEKLGVVEIIEFRPGDEDKIIRYS